MRRERLGNLAGVLGTCKTKVPNQKPASTLGFGNLGNLGNLFLALRMCDRVCSRRTRAHLQRIHATRQNEVPTFPRFPNGGLS